MEFSLLRNGGDILKSTSWYHGLPGYYTSGDFDATTDRIHRDVIETIVSQIPCEQVIKDQFGVNLIDSFKTTNGQLMGSILSFPILCVINLFVYRLTKELNPNEPATIPTINGDDILYRSSLKFNQQWMKITSSCGLIPSKGKNLVSNRYFTINSRPFVDIGHCIRASKFSNFKLCNSILNPSKDGDHLVEQVTNIKKFFELKEGRALSSQQDLDSILRYFKDFGKSVQFKVWRKFRSHYLPISIGGTGLFPTDVDKATPLQLLYSQEVINSNKEGETPLQRELKLRTFLLATQIVRPKASTYKHLIKTIYSHNVERIRELLRGKTDLQLAYMSNQNKCPTARLAFNLKK